MSVPIIMACIFLLIISIPGCGLSVNSSGEAKDWSKWYRLVEQPVFTTEHGNNHDAMIFYEPELNYPYHLIVSHETSGADLWRTKEFSWSSDDWEFVFGKYNIGGIMNMMMP